MRVLGIDPGSLTTGFGVVEIQANRLQAVHWGTIRTSARQPLHERLKHIYDGLAHAVHTWQPEAVSVERVFFADNAKTALTLGHARGVALLSVAHAALPLAEYTAVEIKMAVAGYGHAAKSQMQRMVQTLLCLEDVPHPADAADALAAAICHLHTQSFQHRIRS